MASSSVGSDCLSKLLTAAAAVAMLACGGPPPESRETSRQGKASPSAAVSSSGQGCEDNPNLVAVEGGKICGVQGSGAFPGGADVPVWSYKNIPYAATTGGENRWLLAQPVVPWDGVRDGTAFGPACSQLKTDPWSGAKTLEGSEDCLTVNVYTPVAPPESPDGNPDAALPVMVFIHGGTFLEGTASTPLYDGSNVAGGGGVVVVTLNYRLAVLGFLGGLEAGDVLHGNLGLKDQQRALAWVHANIARFGGDPSRVTLWGESAGASSVGLHLVNDDSRPLIAQGIMQSNHYGMLFQGPDNAAGRAGKLLHALDCAEGDDGARLECLRQAADRDMLAFLETAGPSEAREAEALLCNAFGGFEYWGPMVDGRFIERQPVDTVITQPVLMGTNANEGVLFTSVAGLYPDVPGGAFTEIAAMDLLFGLGRGTEVLVHYPDLANFKRHKGVPMSRVLSDYIMNCSNNQVLNRAVETGNEGVYGYHFTHPTSLSLYPMGFNDDGNPLFGNGCGPDPTLHGVDAHNVCHGNELMYVFGNPFAYSVAGQTAWGQRSFPPNEVTLSAQMMTLWTDFAKHGKPGGGFEAFENRPLPAGSYFLLRDEAEGGFVAGDQLYHDAKCHFWQETIEFKLSWMQQHCD